MESRSLKKEISLVLAELGAIKFGRFKLTSGKESTYYIDLRVIPSYPNVFRKIVGIYVEESKKIGLDKFNVIAGIPTSGLIYASTLAYNLQKPFIYIRKEAKNWGEKKKIEGFLEKNKNVLIVDDLVTTGKSLVEAVNSIQEEGGIVTDVLVFIDREEGGREKLESKKVRLHSFIRIREILKFLVEAKKINHDQYNMVLKQIGL